MCCPPASGVRKPSTPCIHFFHYLPYILFYHIALCYDHANNENEGEFVCEEQNENDEEKSGGAFIE
jgi:hypothetical protein